MKKLPLLVFMISMGISLQAQIIVVDSSAFLDINKIKARVRTGGMLFIDDSGLTNNNFAYPNDSLTNTIFSSNLMVAGKHNQDLHLAFINIPSPANTTRDYYPGPVMDSTQFLTEVVNWNKVWKINKTQIDDHITHWNSPGYTMPSVISHWPVYASSSLQINNYLAPFVDANANNIYDPANGDYPYIRGDQAIYFIYNDSVYAHKATDSKRLGVEIHGMAYGFNSNPLLSKTVFVNFTIYNKSARVYDSVYLGVLTDLDIGFPKDDYIGSDTGINSFFGYNGDLFDETAFGMYGYGANIPVQTVTFLNKSLTSFYYGHNYNSSCDSCLNYIPKYYNYIQGKWCDNSHFCYGGIGHHNCGGNPAIPVNHIYSGHPNDTNAWNEKSLGNVPYDRRGIGGYGPFAFNPGQWISLDVAYILVDSGSYHTGIDPNIDNMFEIVPLIQGFFDNTFPADGHDLALGVMKNGNESETLQVSIYPNPAGNTIHIVVSTTNGNIFLYDISGKLLLSQPFVSGEVNISHLLPGLYFIKLQNDDGFAVRRFVKE